MAVKSQACMYSYAERFLPHAWSVPRKRKLTTDPLGYGSDVRFDLAKNGVPQLSDHSNTRWSKPAQEVAAVMRCISWQLATTAARHASGRWRRLSNSHEREKASFQLLHLSE